MKKDIILILSISIFILLLFIFVDLKFIRNSNNKVDNNQNDNYLETEKEDDNMKINIIVENKLFTATLVNNDASKKFMDMLPLEINMKELNGNEKYYYLDQKLPTNPSNPKTINSGDIMLFGSDCLVLFYKTFNTSYSYTKLGSIDNPIGLKEALGNSDVTIKFELYNTSN